MSGHVRLAYQALAVTISRPPLGAIYSLLSLAASTAYAGAMTSDTLRCDTCSWHSAQLRPAADLGHQAEMIIREERADHQTREEPTIIRGKSRPTTEGRTDHQTREEPTIKRRADQQPREEPTIKRGKSRPLNEGRAERRTREESSVEQGTTQCRTREELSVERGKSRASNEGRADRQRSQVLTVIGLSRRPCIMQRRHAPPITVNTRGAAKR